MRINSLDEVKDTIDAMGFLVQGLSDMWISLRQRDSVKLKRQY